MLPLAAHARAGGPCPLRWLLFCSVPLSPETCVLVCGRCLWKSAGWGTNCTRASRTAPPFTVGALPHQDRCAPFRVLFLLVYASSRLVWSAPDPYRILPGQRIYHPSRDQWNSTASHDCLRLQPSRNRSSLRAKWRAWGAWHYNLGDCQGEGHGR
ncbi:hypothetical protein CALVIDRAFT_416207 [Calocera viscosa TUFC12733]|uniref:Uncharacterized protein n=1 Tax=Calocera viscosa (strain TUFC12733) TaxID=1330018 RepID=A0A167G0M2_CALVF|nr:hypothetical protein CALVIDRAFT_416207 [Calocera viscosa TUFC12733]